MVGAYLSDMTTTTSPAAQARADFAAGISRETGLASLTTSGTWGLAVETEYRTAYDKAAQAAIWKAARAAR